MGKNKLRKFAEMERLDRVFQYPFAVLKESGFPLKGRWKEFFGNDNPVTLELGCGKGEYTVGLAKAYPDCNFVGIDIKGARMWSGAKAADQAAMTNVAFVRTSIELLDNFFDEGEVDQIWITFPDPQMKKATKRLTGTRFIELYRKVMAPEGIINLKTDSPFLYAYTGMMCRHNNLAIKAENDDIYNTGNIVDNLPDLDIKTHYERQWLDRGLTIKYISFAVGSGQLSEPPEAESLEEDTYRSYSRGYIQKCI